MKGRTKREFGYKGVIWPMVDAWAAEHGFVLKTDQAGRRLYQKGYWQLMAPTCIEITQLGEHVLLEAWVKADFFLLMSLLSGKPPEARIDSGGLVAAVPRRIAREAVNKLLVALGQDLIS